MDSKDANKIAGVGYARTNPYYSMPPHMMSGVECQQIKVKKNNDAELSIAIVEAGCQVMMQRTGGRGFPVLLENYSRSTTISVMVALRRVVGEALLYTNNVKEENVATLAEVDEGRGEESSGH